MILQPKPVILLLAITAVLACPRIVMAQSAPVDSSPAASSQPDDAKSLYVEAAILKGKGDIDGALAKSTEAVQKDPTDVKAQIQRGDLYAKKKLWKEAEDDFNAVLKLDKNNSLALFDLAEIKLMQKQYADARPGFLALVNDSTLGDLAAYKVYLCDLFGQDELASSKELAAFNRAGRNASYYYANAAKSLYLGEPEAARPWIDSGYRIYPQEKTLAYLSTLKDFGYLPLPEKK